MPDWLTHTLIGWMTGKAVKLEVGLIVLGSILPDLVKIHDIAFFFGVDIYGFFSPFHTPVGALLVVGIIALFFADTLKIFLTLTIGVATHFVVDFFFIGATKGIQFLFPFSWGYWRFNEITTDYRLPLIAMGAALAFYLYYIYRDTKKTG
jgi:hypothetical protein